MGSRNAPVSDGLWGGLGYDPPPPADALHGWLTGQSSLLSALDPLGAIPASRRRPGPRAALRLAAMRL